MIVRGVNIQDDLFNRNQVFTSTPGVNGWTLAKTTTAGAPTAQTVTGSSGGAQLTLAANAEVEVLCLSQGDVLTYAAGLLQRIDFIVNVAGIDANTTVAFGLGSARNDNIATITYAALFKILGAGSPSAVLVDSRDGANTNTGVATGKALGATPLKFSIDFEKGLADVRFFIDGDRVAAGTTFNMSQLPAGQCLQPIIQLQKGAGAATPQVTVTRVTVQHRFALGA